MRRVLVCGGRDFGDMKLLTEVLDAAHMWDPIAAVVSGMARGADSLAVAWARNREVPVMPFPAYWDRDGRAAGFIRNQRMLDEGHPHLVIAFPGGRGTADMVARARKAGVPVVA